MKRLLIPLMFIITLASLGGGALFWWNKNLKPASNSAEKIRFVIPKGYSASQIGNKLYESKLVRSPLAFKIYVQITGNTRELKPGEFNLSANMGIVSIVKKLLEGPDELWVTIPEGLRREEIVEKFIDSLELELVQANTFRQEFLDASEGKEGFLFPDTYLFPRDVEVDLVVKKMSQTFNEKISSIKEEITKNDYTLEEIIKMASIIEREAKTDEERPVIAGILWKRLETEGWLLQADATVQYAVANAKCKQQSTKCNWWPQLNKDDLEIDSFYNSYKYSLLPPTPISNPGETSIEAAIFPKDTIYWFYIHDNDGSIHYAESIQEHNMNIRNYLGK